jgi:hypothetical protein
MFCVIPADTPREEPINLGGLPFHRYIPVMYTAYTSGY